MTTTSIRPTPGRERPMVGLAEIIMDNDRWARFVDEAGVIVAADELRRLQRSLGQQEAARLAALSTAEANRDAMARNLQLWRRSVSRIRARLNERLSEVRPAAVAFRDAAGADRRSLVILAKRIWLWEEGLDDRLDDALDDCTISNDPYGLTRITLRELVADILATHGEVSP